MNGKLLANAFPINKVEVFFDNEDHSHFLGFTWERVGAGKVPVGINTADSDFDTIGKIGGSKYLQAHTHGIRLEFGTNSNLDQNPVVGNKQQVTNNTDYPYRTYATETTGTGDSGNLQPYIVMAFWKRIA